MAGPTVAEKAADLRPPRSRVRGEERGPAVTKEQLRTLSDLVSIAHDEYDGCPSYRDDLERFDRLLAEIKAETQSAPGNAAALREALTEIEAMAHCDLANVYPAHREKFDKMIGGIESVARAALAVPARNVDRPECATRDGSYNTWYRETWEMSREDCPDWSVWLFSPEGGAK